MRSAPLLMVLTLLWLPAPALADGPQPDPTDYRIALQSRSFTPAEAVSPESFLRGATGERNHLIVQFHRIPSRRERDALAQAGIRLLNYLPKNAWFAAVPTDLSPDSEVFSMVRWIGEILPEDKISARIRERRFGDHAIAAGGKLIVNLRYFADADVRHVRAKLRQLGAGILAELEALNSISLVIAEERIAELAAEDAVRWIEAAPPSPVPESDRMRTHVQVDQAQSLGLTGSGVRVGIFENRHADPGHLDFSGRLSRGDTDPADNDDHPTMVAGVIGGDGAECLAPPHGGDSLWDAFGWCYLGYCEYEWCKDHCEYAYQWKGIATAAQLYTYDFAPGPDAGTPVDNHLNFLGDLQTAVTTHQIDIANNSWGHSGCLVSGNDFDYGIYEGLCLDLDSVVRGQLGEPLTVVFSAGNERNGFGAGPNQDCIGNDAAPFLNYGTMNHPKAAKNIITVGAVDSFNNKMSDYSSWGPLRDGRLKPDLVASGHHAGAYVGQGGISVLNNPMGTPCGDTDQQSYRTTAEWNWPYYYGWFNQTSCAAATTSGTLALLIEDFRSQFPALGDPLPSTLKALLIHTALDLDDTTDWYNPGPDFASGYGLLRIEEAINEMRRGSVVEDELGDQQTKYFGLVVPGGATSAKVTLVWDDAAGTENVDPTFSALSNDLDLVVVDPAGVRHFPWTLDPANPTAPAVNTQVDRLNNVEQVLITDGGGLTAGHWKIEVKGYSVPEGPQSFSVVADGIRGNVLYVSTAGSDSNTGARPGDPLRTIDKAFQVAIDEDHIHVAQGTYYENLWLTRPISKLHVFGGYNADFSSRSQDRSLTVFNGGASDTIFSIYGENEDIELTLEGVTLTNGQAPPITPLGGAIAVYSYFSGTVTVNLYNTAVVDSSAEEGGGIFFYADFNGNVAGTIDNCEIARNQATFYGGGISLQSDRGGTATVTVRDSTVTDNTAGDSGGGFDIDSYGGLTTVDLSGNTISTNDSVHGGGVALYDDSSVVVTIQDCTFSWNSATLGGALYSYGTSPTIAETIFADNTALDGGGAIYNEQYASPTITRSVFARNTADYGGGIATLYFSSPGISSSVFHHNQALSSGFSRGGGALFIDFYSEPTLTNCSFGENSALGDGGAVYISSYTTTVVNSIFWGNTAARWGHQFSMQNGCTLSISHSDVQGGQDPGAIYVEGGTTLDWGPGNITGDPQFAGLAAGDLHLRSGSPCEDAGDNGAPGLPSWDFEGEPRIANGTVDVGADELFDTDADGLPNYFEATTCTDPGEADTDADCLDDGVEDANRNGIVDAAETDPCDADTDNDGLLDGSCGSEDLNGNGVVDPGETDPRNADSDADGIFDGTELGLTAPETADTDVTAGYFVSDGDPATTTDPTSADSDGDGIDDGIEDVNHDGSYDPAWGETDPNAMDPSPDADGDGTPDRDDNCPSTYNDLQLDADADGYGDACDCFPADPMSFPGATELCDGVDNDCDLVVDADCVAACDNPETVGSDVAVSSDTAGSGVATLAWTGIEYGAAWHDFRDGNWEIYFSRLDASGTRIGPEVRVTNDAATSGFATLAWSGTEYGLAWRDDRDGNQEIYFVRLDAAGSKIGSDLRITHDDQASGWPSLVWNGREYGLAWYDDEHGNREIHFARLRPNGEKLMPNLRVTADAGESSNPSLVWTGEEYGVAWHDDRDGNFEIYFARIDQGGGKIGADVRVTDASGESSQVELTSSGTTYGLAWHDDRDGVWEIYFARLYTSGSKVATDLRLSNDAAISGWPDVVWADGEFGVFWHDFRDGTWEIYHSVVDPAGAPVVNELRLTYAGDGSYEPALVWAGDAYALAWHDDRDGNLEIYFNEVRCCGDFDADTYTVCENDCDDQDPAVYPGATETCDYKDNNCDGTIDEGFPTPGVTSGTAIAADKATITWDTDPLADRYDVVKGNLMGLQASGGDFATSLSACLEEDSADTTATDGATLSPGQVAYYLIRTQRDCRHGTFDTGQPGQVGTRDSEIASSPQHCD